jgi:hypothetical protein
VSGDLISSNFVFEFQPGGFLHALPHGLAPSRPGFPTRDYPGKMLEIIWSRFDCGGGGGLAPARSYGEELALARSHPRTVT